MEAFWLKCFGVGDGWPSAERNHASFLYRLHETALMMDCGDGLSRNYKASGLDYDLIDHLFLSHLHFDHVGGFFMLIQGLWLERRKKKLRVHAPAGGIAPLRQMLEAACLLDDLLPFLLEFQPLAPASPVDAGGVQVTAFPTTHLLRMRQAHPAKPASLFEAFSFLVESSRCRLVHSADIGAVEDLAPLLEKPVDLLVCELAHVTPEKLFPFLRARPIGRICFVHLSRAYREQLDQVKALAADSLRDTPHTFADDGEEFWG
jgi:ribonuclease BN (tRNA processing enzyme)